MHKLIQDFADSYTAKSRNALLRYIDKHPLAECFATAEELDVIDTARRHRQEDDDTLGDGNPFPAFELVALDAANVIARREGFDSYAAAEKALTLWDGFRPDCAILLVNRKYSTLVRRAQVAA